MHLPVLLLKTYCEMNNSIKFKQRKKWQEARGIEALRRDRGERLNGRQQVEKFQIMVGELVSSFLSFSHMRTSLKSGQTY